jgi:hypothetical protein
MMNLMMTVQIVVVFSGSFELMSATVMTTCFGVSDDPNPITPYLYTRRHHLDWRQDYNEKLRKQQ